MKRKLITQEDRVLQFLQDNGSITSLDAIKEFGITRLSARIFKLRHQGWEIITEYETSKNRYGDKVCYARYKLK